ncbi:Zinc finger CCCH domain-containing protein 55 [Durusdinium trenchii]|uniref:Zinc finger CCCH domain-containing protein 55 n=2 Tax=Durusdinium trenchii TaxID=1381693 RepID=A0ABP0SP07_9DINO
MLLRYFLALALPWPAATALPPCFPDAVPASQRKNITIAGQSMPVGSLRMGWDSAKFLQHLFEILVTEKMGYNIEDLGVANNAQTALFLLGNCQNAGGNTMDERQCGLPGYVTRTHVTMEFWNSAGAAYIAEFQAWNPAIAPPRARHYTYVGAEYMFTFGPEREAAARDGVALTYYRSWNSTWFDPTPYFSKLTDFTVGVDIANCSELFKLTDHVLAAAFIRVTGYEDAVLDAGTENARIGCWNHSFVLGPGCRNPDDPNKCIPYLTYAGWLEPSGIQKIFSYNTAIAYGEALSWGKYVSIPRDFKVIYYWWSPATEFSDMSAQKLVFPGPASPSNWAKNIRNKLYPISEMYSFTAREIQDYYADIFTLVSRIDLNNQEFDAVMGTLQANWAAGFGGADGYQKTACDFIQANLAKTLSWIPNDLECAAGTGVRTADGGYDAVTREEASYCEWCPPGRFSNPITLTSATNGDINTYRCDACPAGQKQGTGGSTFCEDCSSGTFSSQVATVKCTLCPVGSYMPEKAASQCTRCPAPMVTAEEASRFETQCICPKGMVRPCRHTSAPNGLREGCTCNKDVYATETSEMCIPCPDGLECKAGADEKDLPCYRAMESPELNYPRPLPSHYTGFDSPYSVYKCKDAEICPGQAIEVCSANAYDIACGLCQDGYYRQIDGFCGKCHEIFQVPLVPVILLIGAPIALIIIMKFGTQGISKTRFSTFNEFLGIGYVTVVFIQTLGTNMSIMPDVPGVLGSSLAWTAAIQDITSQFRLQCFLRMSFAVEFALKLLAPLYGMLLFVAMYWISKLCKRLTLDRDVVIGTYGSFFVAFFISIANLSLKLFQTYEHPNGERSMISEPAVITSSDTWLSMVAGTSLSICLYCVGATAGIVYALYNAPTFFKDPGFRKRWKFLFLSVRPSTYWWVTASLVKAFFLSLTTIVFQRPMGQTIWLGTGLMLYFLAVFWFLPWRTATLLWLDVALHYLLAVLCLLMPFFVPANETELIDAATVFLMVCVVGIMCAALCVLGVLRTQSPSAQRQWRLTYEQDARKFVEVFQVMNDAQLMADVLHGLVDVDYTLTISVMKILSVELLGNTESGRLIWRKGGRLGTNKKKERGPDLPEEF